MLHPRGTFRLFPLALGFLQEVSSKSEAEAQQAGEGMEQADLPMPAIPLKIKNIPCEREFYIPSVDLLTAQVKYYIKGRRRKWILCPDFSKVQR